MRVVMTSRCYRCEAEITFSEEIVSQRTGRMVPLDPYTMGSHQCPYYNPPKKYSPCRLCGMLLYFDPDAPKSINGKWVPYEQRSGEPHQCPESDYNKNMNNDTTNENTNEEWADKVKEGLARIKEAKKQEDEDLEEVRLALL
jgi:hypothetical protein